MIHSTIATLATIKPSKTASVVTMPTSVNSSLPSNSTASARMTVSNMVSTSQTDMQINAAIMIDELESDHNARQLDTGEDTNFPKTITPIRSPIADITSCFSN